MSPLNEHGDMIAITAYRKREEELLDQISDLRFELAGLRVELEQQAICNGKGSEREAALLAKVSDLQRQLDNARTDWLCGECNGRGCEAMNQNTVLLEELKLLQRENAGMRELIVKEGYTITYFNDEIALYRDPWHQSKKEKP